MGNGTIGSGKAGGRPGRFPAALQGREADRVKCDLDPLVCAVVHPSGAAVFGYLLGLLAVMAWRVQEARGAVSIRKIVIPPLGMATGSFMFIVPAFRIPWTWAGIAFLTGAVGLAYPLLLTSRLVRQGDAVMMQRSNAFFTVILALAAIRY